MTFLRNGAFFYFRVCLVYFTGTFSYVLRADQAELQGYRQSLNVYEVSSCPQNESLWVESATRLGCNLNINSPDSSTNFYYCIPTSSKSKLVEFCYDGVSQGIQSGLCLELKDRGFIQTVDCTHFTHGCPKEPFLSETIYNYQDCLHINTNEGCYLAEEECPPSSLVSIALNSASSTDQTSPQTTEPITYSSTINSDISSRTISLPNNGTESSSLWPSSEVVTTTTSPNDTNVYIPAVILGCIVPLFLLFAIIAAISKRKKRKQRKTGRNDEVDFISTLNEEHREQSFHEEDEEVGLIPTNNENNREQVLYVLGRDEDKRINDENEGQQFLSVTSKVSISGLKLEGNGAHIICKISLVNDSSEVTSVHWTKNETLIDTNVNQDKYYGGNIIDPSLTVRNLDIYDIAEYTCVIADEAGTTMTDMFHLDEIWTMPSEVKSILCGILLQDGYQLNLNEESRLSSLVTSSNFFNCKIETVEDFLNNLKRFKEYLNRYIYQTGKFKSSHIRDVIVSSLKKHVDFAELFIREAGKENIKDYCRTPMYQPKEGEVCIILNTEQTEVFIEKIKYDILTHTTMEDIASHSIIASKLMIPLEIFSQGKDGIQNYLQQLKNGKVNVYHARGMIVGCAGAGKTTLLKKLKELPLEDIRNTKPTRGVDIQFDVFSVSGDEIAVTEEKIATHFDINQSKDTSTVTKERMTEHFNDLPNLEDTSSNEQVMRHQFINGKSRQDHVQDRRKDETRDSIENKVHDVLLGNMEGGYATEDQVPDTPEKTALELESIQLLSFLSGIKVVLPRTITIFDFAGQLAYYVTHQIFLSARAFYIMVIDMTMDLDKPMTDGEMFISWTYKDIILHWMKTIHALHRLAPVILVASHAEGKTSQDIINFFLRVWTLLPEDFRKCHFHPKRQFAVVLEENTGLAEIKSCILNLVSTKEHWGEERPTSWVIFEDYLKKSQTKMKIMRTKDLWELNKKLDKAFQLRKVKDMKIMLQFFHDTGVILYFDEDLLRDCIILDVLWFVDAFKHIITDPVHATEDLHNVQKYFEFPQRDCDKALKNLQESGILSASLLRAIWKLYEDTYNTYDQYMSETMIYMERLGMVAKLTTKPVMWYVPCMNKIPFSKNEFKAFTVSPTLCFQFTFLPSSVFFRLVAACLNQLRFTIPKWPKPNYFYQNAVLLHKEEFEYKYFVLIGNDEVRSTIEVQILSQGDTIVSMKSSAMIKKDISGLLKGLTRTFHSNLEGFTVGYKCTNSIFSEEPVAHFIPETCFKGSTIICNDCEQIKPINVGDVLDYWNKKLIGNEEAADSTVVAQESGPTSESCAHSNDEVPADDKHYIPELTLEANLRVQDFNNCCHISCASAESAWMSNYEGNLRLVDKNGNAIKIISEKLAPGRGSYTVTRQGDLLFIANNASHVYKVTNEKQSLHFQTDDCELWCIVSSRLNNDLLIGGRNREMIPILLRYNASGDICLQTIQTDKSGEDLYERPWYITENTFNGDVIMSDFHKGVVVVDRSGIHRFTYNGITQESTLVPHGVCSDTSGHILVCDRRNSSVHILSSDGEFLKRLSTKEYDIPQPLSIGIDDKQRLWVGDFSSNVICIYKFPQQQ